MNTFLIQHLYQEDLYQIPSTVTVVVSRPWHDIPDEEKLLLTKILGAVKISPESVVIRSQSEVNLETTGNLNASKVLVFGCAVRPEIRPYENTVISGVSVIRADDLHNLDDARKKNLWMALRQMFGV